MPLSTFNMPHAIIKTNKNLNDIECVNIFRYKNKGILPLDEFRCFLDVYKKQDLLIIKLNKATRSIITDKLKDAILNTAKKIADNLNCEIVSHNLEHTNTNIEFCDCYESVYPQKILTYNKESINNLEIGFGRGEFLINLAKQKPEESFLGIEVYGKDFLFALNRCCNEKLNNVKLLNYDCNHVIDLFDNNSFDNIYVNFPEPWFKLYRIKHSIFNKITFQKIRDKLKQNGFLHIVTDNYPFAVYSAIIGQFFSLKPLGKFFIETIDDFDTLYAKKWKRLNRTFYRLCLQKPFCSPKTTLKTFDFPLKLEKFEYKSKDLIFKILGIFENNSIDYKIIETAIGNYLAQHVFFGLKDKTIFLLPQTNFIYTSDFCDALEKVIK
ncbi:tRNA (guanine-N7-)-methyltransferase [Desulfurella multipotens]|uniref:tRNA (guanine(46)-N(7))-methyltransferase n=1 Tax=Desulfurella multipotens TaxID=79269 RepID=A0A1G6LBQ7_9BACT|nr:hypothetical protein [Desulfurella multipotens]SDC40447.1 tRNA (guanine-N7-)-methyltransferase [Desulfurella multipotens]